MPFKPPKKQPQFADLKGILAQTRDTESPLYQVVQELIERLTQFRAVTTEQIEAVTVPDNILQNVATKFATYHTKENEVGVLPNSWQLLAGTGIIFDDTVANKRTIRATAGGSAYAPVSTGAEPLEIMSDGAGAVLMVGFNE